MGIAKLFLRNVKTFSMANKRKTEKWRTKIDLLHVECVFSRTQSKRKTRTNVMKISCNAQGNRELN